jgi:hypothetical protein
MINQLPHLLSGNDNLIYPELPNFHQTATSQPPLISINGGSTLFSQHNVARIPLPRHERVVQTSKVAGGGGIATNINQTSVGHRLYF